MDPTLRNSQFGCVFKHRVTNFKPLFLSPLRSKLKNFSVHQKENFLRILKLTLLLFLVPFLRELWAFKTLKRFFWDTLYLEQNICRIKQKLSRMEHFSKLIQQEIESIDQKVNRNTMFLTCLGWFCIKYNIQNHDVSERKRNRIIIWRKTF